MLLTNSKIAEIIRLQIREAACDSQHRTASLIGAEGPYVGDIGAEGAYIGPGIQRFKRNNSEKRPLLARRAPADPPTSLRRRVSGRPITFFCELVKAIRDNRLNCGSMARRAAKDRSRLLGHFVTHGEGKSDAWSKPTLSLRLQGVERRRSIANSLGSTAICCYFRVPRLQCW